MQTLNYRLNYTHKCDILNKYILKNVFKLPNLKTLDLKFCLLERNKLKNSTSIIYITKFLLTFYLNFNIFPSIKIIKKKKFFELKLIKKNNKKETFLKFLQELSFNLLKTPKSYFIKKNLNIKFNIKNILNILILNNNLKKKLNNTNFQNLFLILKLKLVNANFKLKKKLYIKLIKNFYPFVRWKK